MIVCGSFIISVIIGWCGFSKLRQSIILYITEFNFVHILPADLYAAFASDYGQAAFHITVPDGCGIIDASDTAVHEFKIHDPAVFEICKLRMPEILETRLDILYVSE